MSRSPRGAWRWLVGGALGLVAAAPRARAEEIFPVVDLHVDVPYQVRWKQRGLPLVLGELTQRTMRRGHVAGVVLPAYVPDKRPPDPRDLDATLEAARRVRETAPFVGDAGVRTWLAIEGARSIEGDASLIDAPLSRGVRLVGLVHATDNALGGSATGKTKGGLTARGEEMARRVLSRGALLDVSHLSDAAFDDALRLSKDAGRPLVASHSNARALVRHARNLTDSQLRAIGETGGVAGLNLHVPYLGGDHEPTMDEIVRMLEHMVDVAGEEHVAIGSDFDGGIKAPRTLRDPSRFPALARALLASGWPAARVHKVFSKNALRVLDAR